jgi:hypothetical protein
MLKSAVHAYYGTLAKVAAVVGITKQGVWMWPKVVPQGHAWKLQVKSGGELTVDPTLYPKITRSKPKRLPPIKRKRATAPPTRRVTAKSSRPAK